jgi:hypothetical protein
VERQARSAASRRAIPIEGVCVRNATPARALAVSALGCLVGASIAFAGTLPAPGVWIYDNGDTVNAKPGNAIFRAYVRVGPTASNIYSIDGILIGGKCRKRGRTRDAGSIGYSAVNTKKIPLGADGKFSATRKAVGDATGVKGSIKVKGVITGTKMSGRVKVHLHNPVFGDCHGRGKFSRAKAEQVG